ncbi:TPA: hypothetical protein ACFNMH_000295 [Neisseria elongata]
MAHLLIDTVKTDAGKKYLPFGRHDVRLFADKKTARPFRKLAASADGTCPECGGNAALHLVIPPKDKFTRTILKTVKVILSGHPEAKIAVISPRGKLQKKLERLQQKYPAAQIISSSKLGKKVRSFLYHDERPSENPPRTLSPEEENELIKRVAEEIEIAIGLTLPPQTEEAALPELSDTLRQIRRSRPKKKSALLHLLTQQHGSEAQQYLDALLEQNLIKIDAAENVRYR